MKTVILCGGQGVRAFPFTTYLPKPMLPIRGTPVLMHVMRNFIEQGYTDFVLAAGYRRGVVSDYFEGKDIGANVAVVDTGENADTGRRIYNCRDHVKSTFVVTYGDGLSDVPMEKVVEFHRNHGGKLTITAVPMYSQYGVLHLSDDGQIERFDEKPLMKGMWINAGFMIAEPTLFDDWQGENFERDVIPRLISEGEAYSYRHTGFFKSFDFYKDVVEMEEIIEKEGELPWRVVRAEESAA
ncbi:MAG: sugar phosphate nucleotidyltransferase [Planctomycetota bacterium]